jgi:hypothetical protein
VDRVVQEQLVAPNTEPVPETDTRNEDEAEEDDENQEEEQDDADSIDNEPSDNEAMENVKEEDLEDARARGIIIPGMPEYHLTGDEHRAEEAIIPPEPEPEGVGRVYGLRPRRRPDYSHRYDSDTYYGVEKTIVHAALTQHMLKKGLEKYQQKGEEAVLKELGQLHNTQSFEPKFVNELSEDEKKEALESLIFFFNGTQALKRGHARMGGSNGKKL